MNGTRLEKSIGWKTAVLLPVCAGFFGMSLTLFLQGHVLAAQTAHRTTSHLVDGSGSSTTTPSQPVRLVIPAIGLNANVQSTGLSWTGNGDMGVPTNFTDVAWYNRGPFPGALGTAVIDGHLDGRNVPKAVFYRLRDLKPGDLVTVEERAGTLLHFVVTGSKTYAYNADTSAIFSGDLSAARLNLITCAGDWIKGKGLYNERIVVFTKLVT